MRLLLACLSVALTVAALPVRAHEFWISPETYTVAPQEQIKAHIRVGQDFKGAAYSYLPANFVRFDLVMGDAVIPVEARIGDRPALSMAVPAEGLVTVVHQTTDSFLTYTEAEKFVHFVTMKDFDGVLEQHAARGLPETGFRERYSRYAKSLVAVGNGAGSDREVGMETEIVALANPYTDDLRDGFPVRVLYQGAPRPDVQVQVFARAADDTVAIETYRTSAEGVAVIAVSPGVEYLVDSVVMRPLEPETENGPVWESLWASLTFRAPQ